MKHVTRILRIPNKKNSHRLHLPCGENKLSETKRGCNNKARSFYSCEWKLATTKQSCWQQRKHTLCECRDRCIQSKPSACEHDYYIQCTNNGLCTDVAPPYKHCHLVVPHTLYAVLRRQRLKHGVAHHRIQARDRTRAGRQPR